MKASRSLTEEQKREADRLEALARDASQEQKYGDAMRHLQHGMAVMYAVEWTPELELAASLQAAVDHAGPAPGGTVASTLKPLYAAGAGSKPLSVAVSLRPAKGDARETAILGPQKVEASALPVTVRVTLPESAAGDYFLDARLTAADGVPDTARSFTVKSIPVHIENLDAGVESCAANSRA